jgi:uncharacterized paraquat-inducible protein A
MNTAYLWASEEFAELPPGCNFLLNQLTETECPRCHDDMNTRKYKILVIIIMLIKKWREWRKRV